MKRLIKKRMLPVIATTAVIAIGAAMLPAVDSAKVPLVGAVAVSNAEARSWTSCVAIGRSLVGLAATKHPWYAFSAAARVQGCGNFNAGFICWNSRRWWGGWARYIVRVATYGRYSRC